jgi:hypothetical protein
MHIPHKICIYCQLITYVWCITNVLLIFTEIIFDEAGHTGSVSTIRHNFRKLIYKL